MTTIRRGAAVAQRYLVTLYFCGVVTQFLLVGLGLFGMKPGDTIGSFTLTRRAWATRHVPEPAAKAAVLEPTPATEALG